MADRASCALAYIVLIMVLAITNIYVKYLNQGEGALRMAAVQNSLRGAALNRVAIAAVLAITLLFPRTDLLDHVYGLQTAATSRRTIPPDGHLRTGDLAVSSSSSPSALSCAQHRSRRLCCRSLVERLVFDGGKRSYVRDAVRCSYPATPTAS